MFMRPSPKINQILEFCLGVAAQRTGVVIHALNFLSNHYHLIITDTYGRVPEFMHWLNEYIAKCINAELGRWENFWAPGTYSLVTLVDEADFINKCLYVLNNAVSSGIVETAAEWPGVHSTPADLAGAERVIERPEGFFRKNGPVPEVAQLRIQPPTDFEVDIEQLARLVADHEQELRSELKGKGRVFLGRKTVLAQSPTSRPRGPEVRRGLNPKIAAVCSWRRVEALKQLKAFLAAYRDAFVRFRDGERDVRFPFGTYGMRVRFGVICHGP